MTSLRREKGPLALASGAIEPYNALRAFASDAWRTGIPVRNPAMIHLALDVGEKRIGVAASDETETLASPRTIIRRTSTAATLEAVARLVAESGAEVVVIGLPVSFDGQLHGQARAIQRFAAKLRERIPQPVVFADEALSSVRAEEALRAAGVRSDRIRERLDAEAARVILQDYLDARERGEAPQITALNDGGDVVGRSGDEVEE